ncbi:augmin complex subunit dgt3 [Scaptodrosophila lebanonensis]|uniref:Augmin complex subunit dgt3 n=1 Tax=Drosophila lebanonensis TaxID=7225 RepID=A0A6J2UJ66_DROLE|nr:augmin complex subunit dgt3 [Scaptodrosophila lebanonensis]
MGDLLSNCEIFKKLGFDSAHQWILYDEKFEKFFNFLSESITDANILTEQEVLERNEMIERGDWLMESERLLKMQQIESENPGLLRYTPDDVNSLTAEIAALEEATKDYVVLIEDMQNTKHRINNNLSELECAVTALQNTERELIQDCQKKAKQLEEVERENFRLSAEAKKSFTNIQVPPLFMHQLPLEQYFLKCDSFMQYFSLYMKDNFKIQDFAEFENADTDMQHINSKLENLQNSIQYYMLAYINEKAKAKATQALIDHIDLNQIHCISLTDMTRETHELQLLNEHHLKNAHDTLLNALTIHVQQHTQQRIELVLYENTKQKLERALRRRENDKHLTKIISDALSNAELVWIAIQLDLEKKRNYLDNSERLSGQAQASWQRVQLMRSLNATQQGIYNQFLHELASLLNTHLAQTIRPEAKSCLYEYEKFVRLLSYALQTMLNQKSYATVNEELAELKRLEQTLRPFVYDSPLEQPMFTHVRYLCPIFNATRNQQRFEEMLRHLRLEFQEKIIERMDKEKLWRYSKLLWIWFLTEPQRVIHAIDEVKKASAKIPALTSSIMRPGGGIQRK